MELVVVITEYAHDWSDFKRATIHSPDKPSIIIFGLGFLGAALVATGVAGEFRIHVRAGRIESDMRTTTETFVALSSMDRLAKLMSVRVRPKNTLRHSGSK